MDNSLQPSAIGVATTAALCAAGPLTGIVLRAFAARMLGVWVRNDGSDAANQLSGIVDGALHLLLLYGVSVLGGWDLRVDLGAAEGTLAIVAGVAFAMGSFFGLRRLQRSCIKGCGDPLGGSLTPLALRGLNWIVGLLSHVVLSPLSEELFFRGLLLGRVDALLPSGVSSTIAAHTLSGVVCFGIMAYPEGVWSVVAVRVPLGLLLSLVYVAGGGFAAAFLAHTAHNVAEFALLALNSHLIGKGE